MENRVALDTETDIPLGRLLPAPWNPKSDISGVYRRGLESSILHFGLRDRLHVWPADDRPGFHYVIDGNQRLAACQDMILDRLVRDHFKLDDDAPAIRVAALREEPSNAKVMARLQAKAVKVPVPVQVIDRLDEGTPFTREDAKLFTSTWNRNHAKYDEVKQADIYREIREARLARAAEQGDVRRAALESRLKAMIRPELPVTLPLPSSQVAAPSQPPQVFTFAAPGDFTPTKEEPWGPVPPAIPTGNSGPESVLPAPQKPAGAVFIPMVFSLSEAGYNRVTESVLRSKSRVFREARLIDALGRLEKLYEASELDKVVEGAVVEIALEIFNKRLAAARPEETHAQADRP